HIVCQKPEILSFVSGMITSFVRKSKFLTSSVKHGRKLALKYILTIYNSCPEGVFLWLQKLKAEMVAEDFFYRS
ncbi:MAG: hypothetical protein Q8N98_04095, partial [bacterium]|nr:hypothetical protein [bacterium]